MIISYHLVVTVRCTDVTTLFQIDKLDDGTCSFLPKNGSTATLLSDNSLPFSSVTPVTTADNSPKKTGETQIVQSGSLPIIKPTVRTLRIKYCLVCSALSNGVIDCLECAQCCESITETEGVINFNQKVFHPTCFVCAQCFQPFPGGKFYEFDGRKYCEHDFSVLFKPCCARCGEFIVGRVIRAMQSSWHPDCFTCQLCNSVLADAFVKNLGRALCKSCNAKERVEGAGRYLCNKCHDIIEANCVLRFKGDNYHPYHFKCKSCSAELTAEAREKDAELYCIKCFDKMGIPICGACRRPIEERVVHALGKTWHVEHFVCAKCEKPFNGTRHFEKKGLPYCETHFHQLFGSACFVCNDQIIAECVETCNKAWCSDHFACSVCDRKMTQKTKFYEYDLKPVCKGCYEKFPTELRKRLAKIHKNAR